MSISKQVELLPHEQLLWILLDKSILSIKYYNTEVLAVQEQYSQEYSTIQKAEFFFNQRLQSYEHFINSVFFLKLIHSRFQVLKSTIVSGKRSNCL